MVADTACTFATLDCATYSAAVAAVTAADFEAARLPALLATAPAERTPEDTREIAARLRPFRHFADMPEQRLARIAAAAGVCAVPRHAVLCAPGQKLTLSLVLLSGEAKTGADITDDWDGGSPDVAVVRPGEVATRAAKAGGRRAKEAVSEHYMVCTKDALLLWLPRVRYCSSNVASISRQCTPVFAAGCAS